MIADDQTGDFLASDQEGTRRIQVSNTTPVDIAVVTQAVDGAAGVITATLQEGLGLGLPSVATQVQVSTDVTDPPLPVVSITSGFETTGITEGRSFTFTVSADADVSGDLEVDLTIPDLTTDENITLALTGGGDSVTIKEGTRSITGTISVTASGGGVDADLPVDVTIAIASAPTLYTIDGTDNEIVVKVKDTNTGHADYPLMVLSGPASVVEGATATYQVTASHVPTSAPLMVEVVIADDQTGDFLASDQEGTRRIQVSNTTPVDIAVVTQAVDGAAGVITATLQEGAGFGLPSVGNPGASEHGCDGSAITGGINYFWI